MPASEYSFSAESTRNPFRYALAVWRFLRSDTDDNIIPEVAIIEIGFARSKFGRRLARCRLHAGNDAVPRETGKIIGGDDLRVFDAWPEFAQRSSGTEFRVGPEDCVEAHARTPVPDRMDDNREIAGHPGPGLDLQLFG